MFEEGIGSARQRIPLARRNTRKRIGLDDAKTVTLSFADAWIISQLQDVEDEINEQLAEMVVLRETGRACGLAAAIAQIASDPSSTIPMVGASGAVAGVMGAYLLLFPRARILTLIPIFIFFTTVELPAYIIIGYWALLQFLNASLMSGGDMLRGGGVAYFAHIGGFCSGMLLLVLLGGKSGTSDRRRYR